jgi:hypothetical protein
MSGCQSADTPMDPKAKLWGEGNVSVELEDTRDWLGN